MKYDYLKCNNLEWKTKNNSGFMKVEENRVILFTYHKVIDTETGNSRYSFLGSFSNFQNLESTFPDLEIVPRNPETYNQFKEGDVIGIGDEESTGEILFATPNIFAVRWRDSGVIDWFEQETTKFMLVPTIYEETLLSLIDLPFKPGDKVIGRDADNDNTWDFGIFEEMSDDHGRPIYMSLQRVYRVCTI